MNQRIWSGLGVTLLMTTLGTATSGQAQQNKMLDQVSEGNLPVTQVQSVATTPTFKQPSVQPEEVVKVGEFQSPIATAVEQAEAVAKIRAYESAGRQVATLYVRDIPVLTFLDSRPARTQETKVGEVADRQPKVASRYQSSQDRIQNSDQLEGAKQLNTAADGLEMENNPVWRATAVAAQLNRLNRDNADANAIAVRWNAECNCYSIEANGQELVKINEKTVLADTTKNLAEDALQATNRLRRLMGNAPPLREIVGQPKKKERQVAQVAIGPVRMQIRGIASWYGPGFHGRRSASGERYNQNALTAAHRSLPFGTNVLVTNLNNGRSVVVRINDRGPFIRGRVIDLSAAAARVLGVMQSGIAPVQVQVIGDPESVAENY
ncbi:MAG: septal ring lytic transglycosylase RlpA family protein [Cyanobacteriota bacterium]